MLRTKLFKAFAAIVLLLAVLSTFLGIRSITNRVVEQAQTQVQLDLSSAWSILNGQLDEVETVMKLVAIKEAVVDLCASNDWSNLEMINRLERIRVNFSLDFLNVISPNGQVVIRTVSPRKQGDYRSVDPTVASAMKGEPLACMALLTRAELEQEGGGLADRAFFELEETQHARKTTRIEETRGMVMECAVPVKEGSHIIGIVQGGVLVNRNFELVDRIREVVFKNEKYEGSQVGTATVFLDDVRISTTVLLPNGNRALGTRVSKKVADRVLDNGQPWVGEAVVVGQDCLTAYDPIRDGTGKIIGMLYVGILKKPFDDMARTVIAEYVGVSAVALFAALILAFLVAGRLARPIHRLLVASNAMRLGNTPEPVPEDGTCRETDLLVREFNSMAAALVEREDKLKTLNRSYMETLGFVSHELKSPVATIINYIFLLRSRKLGELTEKQDKAVRIIERNSNRLIEMVRHYLNLSRIENRELRPVETQIAVLDDVVNPLLEAILVDMEAKAMTVSCRIPADLIVKADLNMTREVFENLVSNAVKYGKQGGAIVIAAEPQQGMVRFTVRNEGPGISPERIPLLFQKFSRLQEFGETKRQQGTGLGLFITKAIVEAHGGTINVQSESGAWVEFSFTLPANAEKGPPASGQA